MSPGAALASADVPSVHAGALDAPIVAEALLGTEGRYVLACSGPLLRTKAVSDGSPVLVRIADAGREQGGTTLYDLRFIGVREGTHDLTAYLETATGAPATSLPTLGVVVRSTLPPGHQGQLETFAGIPLPRMGGYWLLIGALLVVWIVPAALAIVKARRAPAAPAPQPEAPEETPEQTLRALALQALGGNADVAALARLERRILAHWRDRLGMTGSAMGDALRAMRRDAEAAPAIETIERWLHAPPGAHRPGASEALSRYTAGAAATNDGGRAP